jgi:hypothetical protein
MPKSAWDPDNAPSGEDHPDDMMLCEVSGAYDTGAVNLSGWEERFLSSLIDQFERRGFLSLKQRIKLREIWERI